MCLLVNCKIEIVLVLPGLSSIFFTLVFLINLKTTGDFPEELICLSEYYIKWYHQHTGQLLKQHFWSIKGWSFTLIQSRNKRGLFQNPGGRHRKFIFIEPRKFDAAEKVFYSIRRVLYRLLAVYTHVSQIKKSVDNRF